MKNILLKNKIIIITFVIFIIIFVPLLADRFLQPVEFNQFLIQKAYLKYRVITAEELFDLVRSSYSSGLNILFNRQPKSADFENELEVFDYVFSYMPPYAVVYPTEEFYYFSAIMGNGEEISGNIRVADIGSGQGRMGMAYFHPGQKDYQTFDLTGIPELETEKINDYRYEVTYKGRKVSFKIPDKIFNAPRSMKMLLKEKFLGREHDEAGVRLLLFFNYNTNSFYLIHDDESGVAEKFIEIDENHVIGERTRFVYFVDKDYDRKILVSVDQTNTQENNFLDGPQDQIPFKINIREFLERQNPGVMLGGVDEHGVLIKGQEWARVALSPFERNNDGDYRKVVAKSEACIEEGTTDKSVFWSCLVREYWNTSEWRQIMIDKLKVEGKSYPY